MAFEEIKEKDFEEKVLKSSSLVLVDFWADWCYPCKLIEPFLEEIAKNYGDRVEIYRLNVDENPNIAAKFKVVSIPAVIYFKDGKEVDRILGAVPKSEYIKRIETHL
jgi:thioredoxin 1